jgi:CPA2 family monovalent cation:H+ antiporter-2
VLIGAAAAAKLMPADVAPALLVITTLSMISIPILARLGLRLGRPRAQLTPMPDLPPSELGGRVIVAGFGRVGQLVADMLVRHDIPYLAIDANPRLVATEREAGKPVYVGDSTSVMFLRACGLDTARALVITLDQPLAIQAVVKMARDARPDLTIIARARDARHARALYALGVTDAVPETVEASLQLSEAVLVDIGVPMGPVIASIHERRDEFRRLFMKPETASEDQTVGRRALPEFLGRRTAGRGRDD